MILLLVYLSLALVVSFLCSLLEAGLLSLSDARISVMVADGRRTGRWLQEMKGDIDASLGAVLTFNTIAHTIGAAGVGGEATNLWGEEWVGATGAVLTLLILVLSEIIPKSLGASYSKELAPFTAWAIKVMMWISWPAVVSLHAISRLFSRGEKQLITRDELIMTATLGQKDGALRQKEFNVLKNLLTLREIPVRDIMTPRSVVKSLPAELTTGEAWAQHGPLIYTRLPLFDAEKSDFVGVLLRKDLLECLIDGRRDTPLTGLSRQTMAVTPNQSVGQVLDELIRTKSHMAFVVNEHGHVQGIATLEDAIETLLGVEIVDETDRIADMRDLARKHAESRRLRRQRTGEEDPLPNSAAEPD